MLGDRAGVATSARSNRRGSARRHGRRAVPRMWGDVTSIGFGLKLKRSLCSMKTRLPRSQGACPLRHDIRGDEPGVFGPRSAQNRDRARRFFGSGAQERLGFDGNHLGHRARVVREVETIARPDFDHPAVLPGEQSIAVSAGAFRFGHLTEALVGASEDRVVDLAHLADATRLADGSTAASARPAPARRNSVATAASMPSPSTPMSGAVS